jgi:hypothetical protein
MDDLDDTLDLGARADYSDPCDTTLIADGDSLPELTLPTPTGECHERAGLWHRILDALMRAFAPWPV